MVVVAARARGDTLIAPHVFVRRAEPLVRTSPWQPLPGTPSHLARTDRDRAAIDFCRRLPMLDRGRAHATHQASARLVCETVRGTIAHGFGGRRPSCRDASVWRCSVMGRRCECSEDEMFRAALVAVVIAAGGRAAVAGAGRGQRRVVLDSRTGQSGWTLRAVLGQPRDDLPRDRPSPTRPNLTRPRRPHSGCPSRLRPPEEAPPSSVHADAEKRPLDHPYRTSDKRSLRTPAFRRLTIVRPVGPPTSASIAERSSAGRRAGDSIHVVARVDDWAGRHDPFPAGCALPSSGSAEARRSRGRRMHFSASRDGEAHGAGLARVVGAVGGRRGELVGAG